MYLFEDVILPSATLVAKVFSLPYLIPETIVPVHCILRFANLLKYDQSISIIYMPGQLGTNIEGFLTLKIRCPPYIHISRQNLWTLITEGDRDASVQLKNVIFVFPCVAELVSYMQIAFWSSSVYCSTSQNMVERD